MILKNIGVKVERRPWGRRHVLDFFWEKFKSFGAEVKRDHWEGEVGGDYKRRF